MTVRSISVSKRLGDYCLGVLFTLIVAWSPLSHAENANSTQPAATTPGDGHSWPTLSIGLQDAYLSQSLSKEGVLNNAWFISQYAYGVIQDRGENAKKDPERDVRRFIDLSNEEIESALARYVSRNPQLTRQTLNTLIINIEYPVHPRRLWQLLGGENHDQITPEFTGMVQAYARRYEITRKFFPNATLVAYGFGMPDGQGRERPVEARQLNAQILATKMGLFKDINAIGPVLYERFTPGDRAFQNAQRATRQCLVNSLQIIQASHTPLDILVLMSLSVFNGNSQSTRRPADLDGIADRLSYLHELGVKRVIFWNGGEKLNGTNITVRERFQQLRRLQAARRKAATATSEAIEEDPTPAEPQKP